MEKESPTYRNRKGKELPTFSPLPLCWMDFWQWLPFAIIFVFGPEQQQQQPIFISGDICMELKTTTTALELLHCKEAVVLFQLPWYCWPYTSKSTALWLWLKVWLCRCLRWGFEDDGKWQGKSALELLIPTYCAAIYLLPPNPMMWFLSPHCRITKIHSWCRWARFISSGWLFQFSF